MRPQGHAGGRAARARLAGPPLTKLLDGTGSPWLAKERILAHRKVAIERDSRLCARARKARGCGRRQRRAERQEELRAHQFDVI